MSSRFMRTSDALEPPKYLVEDSPRLRTTPTGLCNHASKAGNSGLRNGVTRHFASQKYHADDVRFGSKQPNSPRRAEGRLFPESCRLSGPSIQPRVATKRRATTAQ